MGTESPEKAAILVQAAMEALRDAGGDLPMRDVLAEVESRVSLSDHDRERYDQSGYVRWQSLLHHYSIGCVRAGYIKKNRGRWFLTPEGQAALARPAPQALAHALRAFRRWKAARPRPVDGTPAVAATDTGVPVATGAAAAEEAPDAEAEPSVSFILDTAESQARQEIDGHIQELGPYAFQDLVAALLRGMGYHTPFIAPKGPDGGTDIVAYSDPLGTGTPHIRVQVKHRADRATREEVAALRGIIRQDREIGLFVSSAGFTRDAKREAAQAGVHIELIDLDRLLDLWIGHYDQLSEEDRAHLRLRRVHFLAAE